MKVQVSVRFLAAAVLVGTCGLLSSEAIVLAVTGCPMTQVAIRLALGAAAIGYFVPRRYWANAALLVLSLGGLWGHAWVAHQTLVPWLSAGKTLNLRDYFFEMVVFTVCLAPLQVWHRRLEPVEFPVRPID